MQLSGHLTPSVFHRYDIIDHQDLEDAKAELGQRGDITGTLGPKSGVKAGWDETA